MGSRLPLPVVLVAALVGGGGGVGSMRAASAAGAIRTSYCDFWDSQ